MPTCPVTFDFSSADDAAREARRHAGYLESLAESRASARTVAVEEWRGRFRDDFDRDFTATQRRLSDEAASLRRLAGSIDDAAEAALQQKQTCERDHDHSSDRPSGPQ